MGQEHRSLVQLDPSQHQQLSTSLPQGFLHQLPHELPSTLTPAAAFLLSGRSRPHTSSAAARLHCGGSGQACMAGQGHPEHPARGAACPHRHSGFPLEQGGDVPRASQEGQWKRLDLQRAGGPSAASPATVTHGVNTSQLQHDLPPLSLVRR